ncbi:HAD-IA family hydrolase [Natronoglycomyces albus]|uniref:HAD-IA family hydrolase n=1 Tax=Natronoglycomyces albus TaxID=2811108 RepID=UPI003CCDD7C1
MDSHLCVERTWRAWAARHGLDGDAVIATAHGRQNHDAINAIDPRLNTPEELAWMVEAEENCREGITAIPGAKAILQAIPAQRWAIVTSCWNDLARMRIGIADLPEPATLYSADDVPRSKPDPQGYLMAAAALGYQPSECVVFEDAPAGIAAAKAAGTHVVAVTTFFDADTLNVGTSLADYQNLRLEL